MESRYAELLTVRAVIERRLTDQLPVAEQMVDYFCAAANLKTLRRAFDGINECHQRS